MTNISEIYSYFEKGKIHRGIRFPGWETCCPPCIIFPHNIKSNQFFKKTIIIVKAMNFFYKKQETFHSRRKKKKKRTTWWAKEQGAPPQRQLITKTPFNLSWWRKWSNCKELVLAIPIRGHELYTVTKTKKEMNLSLTII